MKELSVLSFNETVDCLIECIDRGHIVLFNGLHDTVADVVFHDDFACIVDGVPDSRKLDQDITAVLAALDHALDSLQMPYGAGEAVDHRAHLLFAVHMAVGNMPAGMRMRMA